MKRRELLLGGVAAPSACTPRAAASESAARLRAAPAELAAAGRTALPVWAYEGRLPGPQPSRPRGALLDVELDNALAVPTTIHWRGVRVPNAMDGVPQRAASRRAPQPFAVGLGTVDVVDDQHVGQPALHLLGRAEMPAASATTCSSSARAAARWPGSRTDECRPAFGLQRVGLLAVDRGADSIDRRLRVDRTGRAGRTDRAAALRRAAGR